MLCLKKKKINTWLFLITILLLGGVIACNQLEWKSDFLNSEFGKLLFRAPAVDNSMVGICQSDDPMLSAPVDIDQEVTCEQVDQITRRAVERSGGLNNVIDEGDWVVIKVNMVVHYNPLIIKGTATDPRVVKSLIQQIIEQGRARRVTVAEGCATHPGDLPFTVNWKYYNNLSYDGITKELDATTDMKIDWININQESEASPFARNIPVPGGGLEKETYTLPTAILKPMLHFYD